MELREIVQKTEGKEEYCVLSKDGKKTLGCYPTKAEADERLKQVEMFKNIKAAMDFGTEGVDAVLMQLLTTAYGCDDAQAKTIVGAGMDKEKIKAAMDTLNLAPKLQASYLELIGLWRNDVAQDAYTDLEFLMKESQLEFHLLESANAEGTVWKVAVIEHGKSYNKTFYTPESLADMKRIINEAQAAGAPIKCNAFKLENTLNHLPDKARDFMKGFVENIVGWFKNAEIKGKQLVAELHLDEGAEKVRSLLMTAMKKGIAYPFGLSIDGDAGDNGVAKVFDGKEEVKEIRHVESLNSIDCVTWPSAGGKFLALVESICKEEAMFKVLAETLGGLFPDLVKGVDAAKLTLESANALFAEAAKAEPRLAIVLTEANIPESIKRVTEVVAAVRDERVRAEAAAKETKDQEKRAMETVTEETKKLMEETKALKEAMEKDRMNMLLDKVLGASPLPDLFKDTIREEFKDKTFKEEDLRKKISAMEKAVAANREEATTGQRVSVITEERDKKMGWMQNEFDIMLGEGTDEKGNLRESQRGIFGGSIRKAYTQITGDDGIGGVFPRRAKSRLTEGIESGDFPYLLANSATKKLVREYNAGDAMYRKICRVVPLTDFKTQDRVAFGEFGNLATMVESDGYVEFTNPSEEKATYAAIQKGNFISLTRKAIVNDDLRAFSDLVRKIARAALRTLNVYTFDKLLNYSDSINGGTIYDGQALYYSGHSNIATDALSWTALDAAMTAMWKHKDIDSKLELGITPKYLVVPRELKATAERIVNTERFPGTEYNDVNPVYKAVEVLVSPYLRADANNWYLLADPQMWDGIELGFIGGAEAPTLITNSAENVDSMFTYDKLRYKVRHEYGAGVLDYRPFYAGIVA